LTPRLTTTPDQRNRWPVYLNSHSVLTDFEFSTGNACINW